MDFGKIGRHRIKKKILQNELIAYKCAECGIDEWNGYKLSLHLDHINGKNADNRLENLRFLCPNCHSLTKTYCGNNNKKEGHYGIHSFKVSDEELISAMRMSTSIKSALDIVGLSGANNYARVKRLAEEHNIECVLYHLKIANANKKKVDKLKDSGIDFGVYGWVTKASEVLGISPQKTRKFIERNAPELLVDAKKRKNNC